MLILLDIDGVLVPAKAWKNPELLSDGFPAFDEKACKVLQQLLSDGDTIVLTSSHKSNYSIEEWKQIFRKRGISTENITRLEENVENLSRKDEIVHWLNTGAVKEDFIIIDDDKSLNALPTALKRKLVLTSPYVGLTQQHLEER